MKLLNPRRRPATRLVTLPRATVGLVMVASAILAMRVLAQEGRRPVPGAAVTYEQPVAEGVPPSASAAALPADGEDPDATGSTARDAPLPLRGPHGAAEGPDRDSTSWGGPLATMVGSLGLVLGLLMAVAWVMRRHLPAGGWSLPGDVWQVLGRAPLAPRQEVHLVRMGNRLLWVAVSAAGAQTLAEVTDAAEIEQLTALCAGGTSPVWGDLFRQRGRGAPARGGEVVDG